MRIIENLLFLIRSRLRPLGLLFLTVLSAAVLESIGIGSLYPVIDILQRPERIDYYLNQIQNIITFEIGRDLLLPVLFVSIIVLFVIKNTLLVIVNYGQSRFFQNTQADWKSKIFEVYLSQPYSVFLDTSSGELIQKQMVQTVQAASIIYSLADIARKCLTILTIYVLICIVSFKTSLVVTAVSILIICCIVGISKVSMYRTGELTNEMSELSYGLATEVIAGIRQVKAFCAEEYFLYKFQDITRRLAKLSANNTTLQQLPAPLIETFAVIGLFSMLLVMMKLFGSDSSLIPTLAVLAGGLYKVFPMISTISSSMMNVTTSLPSVNTIADLLRKRKNVEPCSERIELAGAIKLEHVSFEYKKDIPVLNDIHMTFKKGLFYGIVGPSGSGKSTLVDLLIGFYRPLTGRITVDDHDLWDLDLRKWRNAIGLISQDTFIFKGTVEENICFGVEDRQRDVERVIRAAETADAHDFISVAPDGYKTVVGERGVKLSGGQKQRLAIARAVYRDPDILIFDEATSSLDTVSEKRVQKAIESLSREKTVIAIAHRLSTIANADHIYVMDRGKVIEQGSHDELTKKNGLYTALITEQGFMNIPQAEKKKLQERE